MKNPLLPLRVNKSYNLSKTVSIVFGIITTIISFDGTPDPDAVIYHIFTPWAGLFFKDSPMGVGELSGGPLCGGDGSMVPYRKIRAA